MATKATSSMPGIEEILTDTAEVQLATFNAGIEFWTNWVQQTTQLSKNLEQKLNDYKQNPSDSAQILLDISETNREYLRELNNLPKEVASKFVSEMDRLQKKKRPGSSNASAKPRRRARAKT